MSIWTPRPPHPDEPACWSWPIPDIITDVDVQQHRVLASLPRHIRHSGMVAALRERPDELERYRFQEFHAGRCALCGRNHTGPPWWANGNWHYVQDHCHRTGQVRGLLCRGCNTREAQTTRYDPALAGYRQWHPAAILNYYQRFSNCGWHDGWPPSINIWQAEHRGPRPHTPWFDATGPSMPAPP